MECQTTLKYIDDIEEIIVAFGPWSDREDLGKVVWLISQLREAPGPADEIRETLHILETHARALMATEGGGPQGGFAALKKDMLLNIESLRQVLSRGGKCLS